MVVIILGVLLQLLIVLLLIIIQIIAIVIVIVIIIILEPIRMETAASKRRSCGGSICPRVQGLGDHVYY